MWMWQIEVEWDKCVNKHIKERNEREQDMVEEKERSDEGNDMWCEWKDKGRKKWEVKNEMLLAWGRWEWNGYCLK